MFESKEEISWLLIRSLLDELAQIQKPFTKELEQFIDDADILNNKGEVIEKLKSEVEYQEQIGLKAMRFFGGPEKEHIKNFFWEISLLNVNNASQNNMLEINLNLASNDNSLGNILFPVKAIKLSDSSFRIWEVIDIDDALASVGELV